MPLDIDYNFGRLAVQRGYLRQEDLEECIEVLVALERVGSTQRLWDVVQRRAHMTAAQIEEVKRQVGGPAPTRGLPARPAVAPEAEEHDWDIPNDAEVMPAGDEDEWTPGDVPEAVSISDRPLRRFRPGELQVTCVEGPLKGRAFVLSRTSNVIGRDDRADVVIKDPSVSRRHAEIRFGPRDVIVEDLHSRNGVYVGGVKVEKAPLRPGCAVRIGRCLLVVEEVPRTSRGS